MIGKFSFFPFGKKAVNRKDLSQKGDVGTSSRGVLGNIIRFVLAGFWLALGHVGSAILCFVTIIQDDMVDGYLVVKQGKTGKRLRR